LLRQVAVSLARQSWLRKIAVSTPGVRGVAWRFVAGEDLAAGLAALRALNARGISGTLNFVGTHVHSRAEAAAAADAAIDALRSIHNEKLDSHLSVKLTQIGLDVDEAWCRRHLQRVLDVARDVEVFVRIDMEEARYVDVTIRIFEDIRERYGSDRVGIVIQSYLRGRSGDLDRLIAGGSRIRLVKGGYWEPADTVYHGRADIDRAFIDDIRRLLPAGRHPAIATHDPVAIEVTRRTASEAGLDRRSFEFQMLYGVRHDLQDRLVANGYLVRCYVPYGGDWFAYVLGCVRRVPGGAARHVRERFRRQATKQ